MRRGWITGAVLTVAFVAMGCGGGEDPADGDVTAIESEAEPGSETGADAEAETESEPTSVPEEGDDPEQDAASANGTEDAGEADASTDAAAALPTQEALEDPCAEHAGREDEVFIELVAPVNEQQVDDQVEVVGCSNVNEGTVSYRVLDGDGRTLNEGFITAECGTGCVGAFRDSIDLSAAEGEPVAYLQFFSESMADGSEVALTEVIVTLA